jgi:hypothetical protein
MGLTHCSGNCATDSQSRKLGTPTVDGGAPKFLDWHSFQTEVGSKAVWPASQPSRKNVAWGVANAPQDFTLIRTN